MKKVEMNLMILSNLDELSGSSKSHRSTATGKRSLEFECPTDYGKFVYLTQGLFGMACLLPFNIIMACIDYYELKVSVARSCNNNRPCVQMPGMLPAQTYPFALQFLNFFGSLFYTIFEDRWMLTENIIVSFAGIQAALLVTIPLLAHQGDEIGYWCVFLNLIVLGWFCGVLQGCLFKQNAKLPGAYIGIFLTSQGLAGIFSNLLRFATLEIWPDQPFTSASFNFVFGVLVSILCIPAQMQLNKNRFAQYY